MKKAFSLIELLIVMSIVGILTAIAVPAYKSYQTRVTLANANAFLMGAVDASINAYGKTGVFADYTELAPPYATGSTLPIPNMTLFTVHRNDGVGGAELTTCPSAAVSAWVTVNQTSASAADLVVIQNMYFDMQGVIVKKCFYAYLKEFDVLTGDLESATSEPGNLVPGCVNIADDPAIQEDTMAMANSC